ncbi:MAG: sulfite exporter TauE/SafE family protein [Gammaproteobacteria bacterium]|nr:sulfite exporter TauE/SafE family protein [Gammaproteobacteria bacterium]
MAALIFVWPGAIAIGLSLGLLGSGGSILTVPVLVYLIGQPEKLAIAGSLAIVGAIAAVGSIPYIRSGLVNWRCVVMFGLPGMAGTYLGAWSAEFVSGAVQLMLFAVVMLAASVLMLKPITVNENVDENVDENADGRISEQRAVWKISLDGLLVGIVTGLVGVGGGFLVVPALVLLGGLPMRTAVATSLVIIALKSFSGFYKYLDVLASQGIALEWDVIALVAALGIVGSLLGSLIGGRIPQDKLQKFFGVFLIAMGGFILVQSARALF